MCCMGSKSPGFGHTLSPMHLRIGESDEIFQILRMYLTFVYRLAEKFGDLTTSLPLCQHLFL